MHLEPAPSRPVEAAPFRCPACDAPTFPRDPEHRPVQVRCPRGHWFAPGSNVCIHPKDLAGFGRSEGGGAP